MYFSRTIEILPSLSDSEIQTADNLCTYLILQVRNTPGLDKGYVRRRLEKLKEVQDQFAQEKLRRLT